jgi:hypothetical protein
MAQAHHPGLLAEPQDLNVATGFRAAVQMLEGIEVATPELTVAARLQKRQPLRLSLRLHARVKALLPAGILGLSRDQDIHLVVIREPVTRVMAEAGSSAPAARVGRFWAYPIVALRSVVATEIWADSGASAESLLSIDA